MSFKLIRYCGIVLALLVVAESFSQTPRREELEKRRLELQQEIRRINDLRTSNLQRQRSVLSEVEELDRQIRSTENLIRVTNQQANLLTREIAANEKKIASLEEELEKLKEDYGKMIQKSYRSKSQQSRVMFLLSSESFLQAYKRLQYMKQYANYRKQQGDDIKARTAELARLNANLEQQREQKDRLVVENRETRRKLERAKEDQQGLIATIRSKESQYAAELRQKQQEIDAVDNEIERIIAEAIAKTNKESGSTSRSTFELTPAAKALAADFQSNKGKLPWPVKTGVVSMRFGQQRHPVLRHLTINSNGVRIDTDEGGKARAIFGGVVSEVQAVKGAGKAVMVRHGDFISIYNNLHDISVRRGDEVSIGEELGTIATNKSSGKTTLHFLLYKNTQKLNPEQWIYRM